MARCVGALEGKEMLELLQNFRCEELAGGNAKHSLAFTTHSCGGDIFGQFGMRGGKLFTRRSIKAHYQPNIVT
jgi:hypothetical protein